MTTPLYYCMNTIENLEDKGVKSIARPWAVVQGLTLSAVRMGPSYISSVPCSAPMSLINLGCFCASTSHGCSLCRARSEGMDIGFSIAPTPAGLHDGCGAVSTMRTRLGFSLIMSKDEFHPGGRGVRRTRNEGERDSSKARGHGWFWGKGKNSTRGSTMATSCFFWRISRC
jgi:hypothetical protein